MLNMGDEYPVMDEGWIQNVRIKLLYRRKNEQISSRAKKKRHLLFSNQRHLLESYSENCIRNGSKIQNPY